MPIAAAGSNASHPVEVGELRRRARGLTHEVVATLSAELQGRAIPPGGKLPSESALMARFGVGRGVVREALSQLQAAGSVQTHQGVGTFALEPTAKGTIRLLPVPNGGGIEETLQLLELRTVVECDAAGLAAARRTDGDLRAMRQALDDFVRHLRSVGETVEPDQRFHAAIAAATGNPFFSDLVSQLGRAVIPHSRVSSAWLKGGRRAQHLKKVNLEHEEIYAAVARGDVESARAAMRLHLANSRERQRSAHAGVG